MEKSTELRRVIGENVRRLRKFRDLTQEQLAEKVGISAVFMNRIEQGYNTPSSEVLFGLADALGVKADELRQMCNSAA